MFVFWAFHGIDVFFSKASLGNFFRYLYGLMICEKEEEEEVFHRGGFFHTEKICLKYRQLCCWCPCPPLSQELYIAIVLYPVPLLESLQDI